MTVAHNHESPAAAPVESMAASLAALGRILVVEDNIVNQRLARKLVEKLGYRVDVAANGQEAVEAFGRMPYDLVLMDCQMPVMNGFDATQQIRRDAKHHVPILALTASALKEDLERCVNAGMDQCLTKPIRFEHLDAALKRWIPRNTPTQLSR
jgi:CheY-like chemotaxis protein